MKRIIQEQILAIRDTGETNMLDVSTVQAIAQREGFYELAVYLDEHKREYAHFIFTGEAGGEDDEED
jgi:hypothetical protein